MGSHGISLAKEANAFLEHDCIPSVSVHAMVNKHEQPFVVEQGRYYPTSAGCYGYYCTDFDPIGSRVDHSNILQLDGPDLYHPAQPAESLHYAYYPPNPAYEQSAYNPFNPYIPGAFVGTDGPFVVSQPYHRGSPYQQPFYSPSYFPVVIQPRIDTSTFSLPDNSLPDVSITTTTSLSAECGPSSSVSTVTISEGTSSQSFNAGRKSQNLAANIQNLQTIDVKSAPVAHKAANNLTIQLPYREFVTSRYRGSDTLSEQNAAPRGDNFIDQQTAPVSFKVYSSQTVGNATQEEVSICPDQCNGDEFPVSYPDAKFFVIKSYSEDDIQQSIKYNVWSSTPNGNKRLDAAYQDAQRRSCGNHRACPIFLFFSVNASGKFCGVAEMIGPVDFQNDMNFWQQDKWSGSFPVKWHLIKDVPNPNFRHIRLENNENKPVTNSRDTQEVMYIEGIEMLKIFKSYASKTSILDDFMYYEEGQKALFRKMPKQPNLVDMDCCLLPSVTNNTHTDDEQATSLQVQDPNEVNVTRQVLVDDIENESSIMKIDSLTIEPKEVSGSTANIGSENNDSVDTVTVGSITIKVSGIASAPFSSADNAAGHNDDDDASNLLTIGTISFDPKAFEQGRHCAFKVGNRSTCGRT